MAHTVFWLGLALLFYTFAGYPLAIHLWSRWRPRSVASAAHLPTVAIVVVMYNEATRVRAKIETCRAQDYPAERLRIVVASDGSTDSTNDIVREFGDRGVSLLAFAQRRGKAACLNDAVASCSEDIIVFTDARQRLNPEAVRTLAENFADPQVGCVSGELHFVKDGISGFGEGVDAYWRYEKFIRRREAMVHSVPGATGALYALRRSAFRPISPRTILDDVVIPMQAVMQGLRVVFDARAVAFDSPSTDASKERVRKVRTLAGNFQLLAMYPQWLLPWRNPIFVQFVSHKLLRLLAPWAMIAVAVASAVLARDSIFFALAFGVQVLSYGLPLLGQMVPTIGRLKLARLMNAFVSLNWFAALGLVEFIMNRDAHLWSSGQGTPANSSRG
jgi:cellulose synthase/poly-beta-1,6-N-acetylglucosamine synthase-like glycosyltransferase